MAAEGVGRRWVQVPPTTRDNPNTHLRKKKTRGEGGGRKETEAGGGGVPSIRSFFDFARRAFDRTASPRLRDRCAPAAPQCRPFPRSPVAWCRPARCAAPAALAPPAQPLVSPARGSCGRRRSWTPSSCETATGAPQTGRSCRCAREPPARPGRPLTRPLPVPVVPRPYCARREAAQGAAATGGRGD